MKNILFLFLALLALATKAGEYSAQLFLDVGPNITSVAAGTNTIVRVFIDVGALGESVGPSGIQAATFYVKYDATILSLSQASDVTLGALLTPLSANYAVGPAAGFGSGLVGVGLTHSGTRFYTGTAGGHLVELDFHVLQTTAPNQTTLLDLVPAFAGHLTTIADQVGTKYSIIPNLTTYAGPLTQAGALTPANLISVDSDAGDGTIQIVASLASPSAVTSVATSILATSAIFNGTVNPNGADTTTYFQYGLTTNYGSFSATNSLAATNSTLSVSNLISTLASETLYHYQLVASNSAGLSLGGDMTFTTDPFQPVSFVVTGTMQAPGGVFQLNFTNLPGLPFTVLGATNLGQPLSNWTTLGAPNEPQPGQYQFSDFQAVKNLRGFYRVRSP